MKIPRLSFWDEFYIFEGDSWRKLTPEEVVDQFNILAQRHEQVVADIEELINGFDPREGRPIRPGSHDSSEPAP